MTRHALTDNFPLEHVQGGEQRRGAVALVIVRHRSASAGVDRQAWLRPVERLDLTLLIDAQNQRLVRRIHIETNDIGELFHRNCLSRLSLKVFVK